jgi:putative DNA primase/helicase
MSEAQERMSGLAALARYVDADAHDPEVWQGLVAVDVIRDLAGADATEVDALLLAARGVPGARRGAVDELGRAVKRARKDRRSAARETGQGSVVGMDGRPVEGDAGPEVYHRLDGALAGLGCPWVPHGADIPNGYKIRMDGAVLVEVIDKETGQPVGYQAITSGIVAPVGRVVGVHGAEWLVLAWRRNGRWVRSVAPREMIADRAVATRLVGEGMPADVSSLRSVQVWISRCEAVNIEMLPEARGCETMGWVDPRSPSAGFLLGSRIIGGPVQGAELVGVGAAQRPLTDPYHTAGTLEGWRDQVWARVKAHPRAALIVYVGCAAPLLGLIPEAAPLVGDMGGPSSTGKSVAMEAAASVWGHPIQSLGRWDSTGKGLEGRGRFLAGIPLIMDDTKEAASTVEGRSKIKDLVYAYTSTGTRSRTGQDGRTETLCQVRGVFLTAGETPVADMADDAQGAITRLLTVREAPWDIGGRDGARLVQEVRAAAGVHYGHAGEALVGWLARRTPEEVGRMRAKYRGLVEDHQRRAADNGLAQRMAAHLALVEMAAICCGAAWGVPVEQAAIKAAAEAQVEQGEQADVVTRAYEAVEDFVGSRPGSVSPSMDYQYPASIELIGRWHYGDEHPLITAAALSKALNLAGFDARNVTRQMLKAGFLRRDRQRLVTNASSVQGYRLLRTCR